jgi:hypothetical protein
VLRSAVVCLQAAEPQPRRIGNVACQLRSRLSRGNAAALHSHFDFHEAAQLDTGLAGGTWRGVNGSRGIETQGDGRVLRQRSEPVQLVRVDDFVGDQDIANAATYERFGLADLLAALPHCTCRDLHLCNRRALVRLRVRSKAHACRPGKSRHALEVLQEGVEIDDQCRRVDFVDRRTDAGGDVVHVIALLRGPRCYSSASSMSTARLRHAIPSCRTFRLQA